MLKKLMFVFCCIFILSAVAPAQEKPVTSDQETNSWNTVCPVEGKKVNPEVKTIIYNDKNYGFCSNACATVFNEDPDYHAAQLNEDGTEYKGRKKDKRTDAY